MVTRYKPDALDWIGRAALAIPYVACAVDIVGRALGYPPLLDMLARLPLP